MLRDLRDRDASGAQVAVLPFWRPSRAGSKTVDAGCLSQWHRSTFEVGGRRYANAEQFMMWSKAELFGDHPAAEAILDSPEPARAKELGRAVRSFDTDRWAAHAIGVVVAGNRAKFTQNPPLAAYLAATGDAVLVEASPRDRIWGAGVAAEDRRLPHPAQWPGLNQLGFILTALRDELR